MNVAAGKALGLEAKETTMTFANKPLSALPLDEKLPLTAVADAGGRGQIRPLEQALVGDAGIFQSLQLIEEPAGLIGLDVLGKGRLILSIASQQLWSATPGAHADE
mmetsp:Transcript_14290/g.22752  ORF Transcript_14290/g.22752 Transcript_14290/m.22752 type:complete len:106 (+) Transcript_14290:214-531(+)